MFEIGLVAYPEAGASEVCGPYQTRDAAVQAANRRNKHLGRRWPRWMWARYNEITRLPDCVETVPWVADSEEVANG